jgi:adenosylcobinamide-GDP ribazoletransferase
MRVLRALLTALGFLTRLPVAHGLRSEPSDLGRALALFPAVGLLLGALLAGCARALRGHLSSELIAVALVALLTALTGGLHLDGVADVFDGLGGGRGDRARTLEIMRDSRIGALGAAALQLTVLAKLFALRALLPLEPNLALYLFPLIARACVVPLVVCFPYAREAGLGAAFHAHGRMVHVLWAAAFTGAALVLTGGRAIYAAFAALSAALALAWLLQRRLGGLTGDVYGAAIELSEVAFLWVIALRP